MIHGWQGEAFNQDPDSPNEIHGDDLAQAYGFQGGLVPGVTVSTYLAHPAVEAWGLDFLERGHLHAKVLSPLYDHESFEVRIKDQSPESYTAELLRPDGTLSAQATALLPESVPDAPSRRGDAIAPQDFQGPAATRENCERLRESGCLATHHHWCADNLMRTYLRDPAGMPELLAGDAPYANMSFILSVSNWAAATNIHMNPWIHLETSSQNYRPVTDNTQVIAEMSIVDLFEKKGHEFFDAEINLFDEADDACLCSIRLRAIYKLREPN